MTQYNWLNKDDIVGLSDNGDLPLGALFPNQYGLGLLLSILRMLKNGFSTPPSIVP